MDLNEKNFILTGGSLGIGKATAKKLVNKGANVLITGRSEDRLKAAAEATGAQYIVADITKEEDIGKTYEAFFRYFDRLDGLINNAGVGFRKELEEVELRDLERVYRVNVYGPALMAKRAASIFKEQYAGNIVNIASTAGVKGHPGGTVYASSKFALRGMTYSWQMELRPYNVRVFVVNPSEVTTAIGSSEREERPSEPHKLRPEEIAHAIVSNLEMDTRGFVPELNVIATNPWSG